MFRLHSRAVPVVPENRCGILTSCPDAATPPLESLRRVLDNPSATGSEISTGFVN
jgi:hypothetical protein